MKEKLIIGIILLLFISLMACNSVVPEGKWDDNIKLSTKDFAISSDAGELAISTKGTSWWINGVGLNDDWTYDFNDIDTSKDNFIIEESEFSIERKNANDIYISLTENQNPEERILVVSLQAGNYFDRILIIQSSN